MSNNKNFQPAKPPVTPATVAPIAPPVTAQEVAAVLAPELLGTPPAASEAAPAPEFPAFARIATPSGRMLHIQKDYWFTTDSKKVELDDFIRAQLRVGKLVIAND